MAACNMIHWITRWTELRRKGQVQRQAGSITEREGYLCMFITVGGFERIPFWSADLVLPLQASNEKHFLIKLPHLFDPND
jgi:hypothetical protein